MSNHKNHGDRTMQQLRRLESDSQSAQAKAPEPPPGKPSCVRCKYTLSVRMSPTDLRTVMQCIRFPPSHTIMPTPQGLANMTGFPHVNAQMWCFEFVPRPVDDGSKDVVDPKKLA